MERIGVVQMAVLFDIFWDWNGEGLIPNETRDQMKIRCNCHVDRQDWLCDSNCELSETASKTEMSACIFLIHFCFAIVLRHLNCYYCVVLWSYQNTIQKGLIGLLLISINLTINFACNLPTYYIPKCVSTLKQTEKETVAVSRL